jgi:hypothetical protein
MSSQSDVKMINSMIEHFTRVRLRVALLWFMQLARSRREEQESVMTLVMENVLELKLSSCLINQANTTAVVLCLKFLESISESS